MKTTAKRSQIPMRHNASRESKIGTLVNERQQDYDRNSIIGTVIRAWAHTNNILIENLEDSYNLDRFLGASPAGALQTDLITTIGPLSLKDVEVAFENLIEAARKRSEGVVYTPNYVIDYIIKYCIKNRRSNSLPRFLDPACGSGGFAIRAATMLAEAYDVSLERVIGESLHGLDVNPDAVECARVSLDLFCAERRLSTWPRKETFYRADSLLTPLHEICNELCVSADGFDLITTNPPYVKLQNLDEKYRELLKGMYPEFAQGSYSLAMLFLVASHRMLTPSGMLGFITQNNLFTSLAGEGVRQYLQQNESLHSIMDFGHFKVFSNASAYTCLMFLDKMSKETFGYITCPNPKTHLNKVQDDSFHRIKLSSLQKKKWRLIAPNHLDNINRLESNGAPLGVIADIRVGFATLKDSVFLLNGWADNNHVEVGITVPAIKIAEFSTEEQLASNNRRVIRPYRKSRNRWVLMAPDEIRSEFPNAYAYLERNRGILEGRDKGKASVKNFYEWGRSQCMEAPGPKLLTKTFNRGPKFFLDKTDSLFCNGYSIKPRLIADVFHQDLDIKTLQHILNSSVMDYYARLTTFQIDGGFQCFQKNFIERFSIPAVSDVDRRDMNSMVGGDKERFIAQMFGISYEDILDVVHPD